MRTQNTRVVICCFLFLLLNEVPAHAQSYVNLFSLSGVDYLPVNNPGKRADISIENIVLSANLPLVRKNKDVFMLGLGGNALTYRFQSDSGSGSKSITGKYLQTGYIKKWGDNKSLMFLLIARSNSNGNSIRGENIQVGGLLLATIKKSETFKYKYGIYFNREFFGPYLVPLLGLDWKINPALRLFGVLPSALTFEYQISPRFRTGIIYASPVTSYRINNTATGEYLEQRMISADLFLEYYLTKRLILQGRTGYSVGRKNEVYARSDQYDLSIVSFGIGEKRTPMTSAVFNDLQDCPQFQLGLFYRLELE